MELFPYQIVTVFENKKLMHLAALTKYCEQKKLDKPIGKTNFEGGLYTPLAKVKTRMAQMYNIPAPLPKTQGKGCAEVDFYFGTDYLTPTVYLGMIAESINNFIDTERGALDTAARLILEEIGITLDAYGKKVA